MTDVLSADRFQPYLNQSFRISTFEDGDDEFIDVELIEVSGLKGDTKREDRSPFALLFRGPSDVVLEQQTFKVEQESLGEMAIFLVTVGPDPDDDEKRLLHEAVFT